MYACWNREWGGVPFFMEAEDIYGAKVDDDDIVRAGVAEASRISMALEGFVLGLSPKPDIQAMSVTFLHWAARCAGSFPGAWNRSGFCRGAWQAFQLAVEDFTPPGAKGVVTARTIKFAGIGLEGHEISLRRRSSPRAQFVELYDVFWKRLGGIKLIDRPDPFAYVSERASNVVERRRWSSERGEALCTRRSVFVNELQPEEVTLRLY